mgnify:CR=1 FL=1
MLKISLTANGQRVSRHHGILIIVNWVKHMKKYMHPLMTLPDPNCSFEVSNNQKLVKEAASSFVLCFLTQSVNPSHLWFDTVSKKSVA